MNFSMVHHGSAEHDRHHDLVDLVWGHWCLPQVANHQDFVQQSSLPVHLLQEFAMNTAEYKSQQLAHCTEFWLNLPRPSSGWIECGEQCNQRLQAHVDVTKDEHRQV